MEHFSKTGVGEYLELIRQAINEGQEKGCFRPGIDARIASNPRDED